MDQLLLLLLLLWSSGLQAAGENTSTGPGEVRLVGEQSRCAGELELKHQGDWRLVRGCYSSWTPKRADVVCRELDCGSAVSVEQRVDSTCRPAWLILCSGKPISDIISDIIYDII
ncbi:scavenger receptor cysteine-rich type 1 protein M130-like [Eleginops maclovinus]|uniref:scavenger receptor cysteine-rich type 1 protein M130-like n=1 Tax=Eleginops maclovinus TaxID=56733 RepID=UPI003080C9BD